MSDGRNGQAGGEGAAAPAAQVATVTAVAPVEPVDHVLGGLKMRDVDPPEGADLAMILPVTPQVTNHRGGLQGGLICTLIDVVAGRAAGLGLEEGDSVATADMNVRFLSAVTVGPAYATARILRRGRSLVVVQVDVHDQGRDVLAAVSTLSFAHVRLRPGQDVHAGRTAFPRHEA